MIHPILKSYIPIVEGLAQTFGENCEVVLHDIKDVSTSVVAISNSHVSGREEGSPITNLGLNIIKKGVNGEDLILNYRSNAKDKIIKSSSMMIRDENGELIGCLCINYDITAFKFFESTIKGLTDLTEQSISTNEIQEEKFSSSVSELTSEIIQGVINEFNKPIDLLSKEEKIEFVRSLDNKGIFLIKGAIQEIASLLNVSKFTIYNYLDKG